MPYRAALIDDVFFVRMTGTPSVGDMASLVREVQSVGARRELSTRLLAISPRDASAPTHEAREYMARSWEAFEKTFVNWALVLEGSGLALSAKRAAIAGLLLVIRPKMTTSVHATPREALEKLLGDRRASGASVDVVLREAGRLGLLGDAPGEATIA